MSRKCELTGKGPATGNLVSHSNIKTRTRWLPNLKRKQYTIPELSQTVTVRLSTTAIKTIDKLGGIVPALFWAKEEGLSEQLLKIRNQVSKKYKAATKKSASAK
ncbi:MAG: 50S ribosomal protein L28 [Bdellovibrionales bacterium]|nr:50S ribosomal protein L28 [Bdellovibrionales bacterium]